MSTHELRIGSPSEWDVENFGVLAEPGLRVWEIRGFIHAQVTLLNGEEYTFSVPIVPA